VTAPSVLLFVLPEPNADRSAALAAELGVIAYEARQHLGTPGFARAVKLFQSSDEGKAAAKRLSAAGLTARVLDRGTLEQWIADRPRITSWEHGGLIVHTSANETIDLRRSRLSSIVRVQSGAKSYQLALYTPSRFDPLFVLPSEVASTEAGLDSPMMIMERALASLIPLDRWITFRSIPGAQLVGSDALVASLIVTARIRASERKRS
jgi:hypothetical protein